jgi:hypothetical protein
VNRIQSLLRHSLTSTAIIHYLGKSMTGTSAGLAEEAALGATLKTVRSEIKALAAQLESQHIGASQLRRQQGLTDLASLHHNTVQTGTTAHSNSASSTYATTQRQPTQAVQATQTPRHMPQCSSPTHTLLWCAPEPHQVCALATAGQVLTGPHRPDPPGSECAHTQREANYSCTDRVRVELHYCNRAFLSSVWANAVQDIPRRYTRHS